MSDQETDTTIINELTRANMINDVKNCNKNVRRMPEFRTKFEDYLGTFCAVL